MRGILVLLVVATSSLVVGCGGGPDAPSSPSPTHASPSPTPTALSQSQQLVIYLHQLSKYVKRENAIGADADKIHIKQSNHSALQSAYANIAQEASDLSIAVAVMNPPKCVAGSHQAYVRSLRTIYLAWTALSNSETDWQLSTSMMQADRLRALSLAHRGQSESATWWFELRVTAGKLHVRIPFSNPVPSAS